MAEDKTLLKKDLGLIIKLNSRLHYDNIEEVKKVYHTLVEKNMFVSSLGQRYLKKLELIIQGTDNVTCLLCGKECVSKSVICPECSKRIHLSTEKNVQPVKPSEADDTKIRDGVQIQPDLNSSEKVEQAETNDKKKKTIKIIAVSLGVVILAAIGLNTIFTILMLVSLGVLIFDTIKKKPKKAGMGRKLSGISLNK